MIRIANNVADAAACAELCEQDVACIAADYFRQRPAGTTIFAAKDCALLSSKGDATTFDGVDALSRMPVEPSFPGQADLSCLPGTKAFRLRLSRIDRADIPDVFAYVIFNDQELFGVIARTSVTNPSLPGQFGIVDNTLVTCTTAGAVRTITSARTPDFTSGDSDLFALGPGFEDQFFGQTTVRVRRTVLGGILAKNPNSGATFLYACGVNVRIGSATTPADCNPVLAGEDPVIASP